MRTRRGSREPWNTPTPTLTPSSHQAHVILSHSTYDNHLNSSSHQGALLRASLAGRAGPGRQGLRGISLSKQNRTKGLEGRHPTGGLFQPTYPRVCAKAPKQEVPWSSAAIGT